MFIDRLGAPKGLEVCGGAGPTGHASCWQLEQMGAEREVVAPSLTSKQAGERIKTDRRDAEKLAECYCAGMLTSARVPTARTRHRETSCGPARLPGKASFDVIDGPPKVVRAEPLEAPARQALGSPISRRAANE